MPGRELDFRGGEWLSDHLEAGKRIQGVPSPALGSRARGSSQRSHLGTAAPPAKATGLKGSEGVLFPAKGDWAWGGVTLNQGGTRAGEEPPWRVEGTCLPVLSASVSAACATHPPHAGPDGRVTLASRPELTKRRDTGVFVRCPV